MKLEPPPRRFEFARDSFAFANELVWEYRLDSATGKMNFRPRAPKPDYAHRCFVLVRAARQFLYHAEFDATQPVAGEAFYRRQVRAVMARSALRPATTARVVIPGYAGLREFSAAWPELLKSTCGGAWRSYVLRSHWRMVFPISRVHQARTAAQLAATLAEGIAPIIHLVKFPALTINHGMIVFAVARTATGMEFSAYDPNDPAQPARLTFDAEQKTFSLPPNCYWAGGALDLIQIYRNWWL